MSLKMFTIGTVIAMFAAVSLTATAEDKAGGIETIVKKPTSVQELTLTGKIILKEDIKAEGKVTDKVEKDKEVIKIKEAEAIVCKYALVEADGTEIGLPEPKAKPGEKAIDLVPLIGKNVKIVAKGKVKTVEGKKHVTVKSIVSVTEEAAPAAAPEAAPAAAPAAPAAQ